MRTREVLKAPRSGGQRQDATRLHQTSQSNPGAQELPDGGLDNRAQSSSRPRAEDLDAVRGSRNTQVIARSRENEYGLTSEEVKAPGRHRVATGLANGISSGSHRAGSEGRSQAECLWTVSLPDDPKVIVERYHRESLPEWLRAAIERNARELELAEPCGIGSPEGYRSPCWRLAGELRGHPLFTDAAGSRIAKFLDMLISWSELPCYDSYDAEMDPRDTLIDAIDFQIEHDIRPLNLALPPSGALELAEHYPLFGPDNVGGYPRAVSLMFWYQLLLRQNGWFFLAVDTLASLLEWSSRTSSMYMKRAVREGLVEIVQEHERHLRKATEYRWIGKVELHAGEEPFDVS